jgi:hypothetical protein
MLPTFLLCSYNSSIFPSNYISTSTTEYIPGMLPFLPVVPASHRVRTPKSRYLGGKQWRPRKVPAHTLMLLAEAHLASSIPGKFAQGIEADEMRWCVLRSYAELTSTRGRALSGTFPPSCVMEKYSSSSCEGPWTGCPAHQWRPASTLSYDMS